MRYDETTHDVLVYDTVAHHFYVPTTRGEPATSCLSSEAILYGAYMVVIGGWTTHGLVSEARVLSLDCAHKAPEARPARAEVPAARGWDRRRLLSTLLNAVFNNQLESDSEEGEVEDGEEGESEGWEDVGSEDEEDEDDDA